MFAAVLIVYHLITFFGLSYFFTGKNLSLGPIGENRAYAKAHFDMARMIAPGREDEPAVFAVLCPDKRSSFILLTTAEGTQKINKKLENGKTVNVRGTVTPLDEDTRTKYTPYLRQYGYELSLLRGDIMTQMTFSQYYAQHKIINSITLIILLLILFFLLRSLMYGSYGKLKANARKFGYELDDIKKDFETAEKFGKTSVGSKYIYVTKAPITAVAGDDAVLAYLHCTTDTKSSKTLKRGKYSVVIVDRKGREYEIPYPSEAKAMEALAAIGRFSHITMSYTDEHRNKVRTSLKTYVEMAENKKQDNKKLEQ